MPSNGIGTLSEQSLHAAIKAWYARPEDQLEVKVDGFVIDILQPEKLVEIQTRHLYAMKRKLKKLLSAGHQVHVLHPIPVEKWIRKETTDGTLVSRRKSPRRGQLLDLFSELVRMPDIITEQGLSLEILLTQQEDVWQDDGKGSWRRKGWSIVDRRLLAIQECHVFKTPADYLKLLPAKLPSAFTTRDLAAVLHCRTPLAAKIAYTFHKTGQFERTGRRGRAYLYQLVPQS